MVEAISKRVSLSSFRKTFNISCRNRNLIFLVSRTLLFACILRISTVIINLLIITMFSSTCWSSQKIFSNKQNRVEFAIFLQLSGICSQLRIHWRLREIIFKKICWPWSTTKAITTDTEKQTLMLPYKSACQCLRKMSQTNFNNQKAYNENADQLTT